MAEKRVYILATLDTKGHEAAFVRDVLSRAGVPTCLVDSSCIGQPTVAADIPREQVFLSAGTSLVGMQTQGDRGVAVMRAAEGAARLIRQEFDEGNLAGVLGLGGSAGTTIGTAAMRALPLGVPKLMVSTLASGQTRPYVGEKDVLMLNSVVDILGINRISREILTEAAAAMAGMVRFGGSVAGDSAKTADKPLVAATMFGVTTTCVTRAREVLEAAGYEVLVFHATGAGGKTMESLIREGLIAGVLDVTTTELADELVGGVLSAGPERLTAAAQLGVPQAQVISVGALDMVNFGPKETVPESFRDRHFHVHNATVTLMRTTPEENAKLGREIAEKAAKSKGPVAIMLPLLGVSAIDRAGASFDDPVARQALCSAIREHHGSVELIELDDHINDAAFAEAMANKLIAMMKQAKPAELESRL